MTFRNFFGNKNIVFKVYGKPPQKSGKSKKDLDNLLKILFDVLSVNMRNGQDPLKGLGLMKNDTYVYKIKCEKKENSKNREEFDLKIFRRI